MEYLATPHKRCIVTGNVLGTSAESCVERKQRREAEIAALKEALTILEGLEILSFPSNKQNAKYAPQNDVEGSGKEEGKLVLRSMGPILSG